jgi:hypothetical protein
VALAGSTGYGQPLAMANLILAVFYSFAFKAIAAKNIIFSILDKLYKCFSVPASQLELGFCPTSI